MEFKHKRGSILILFNKISQIPIIILSIIVSIVIFKTFDFEGLVPTLFIVFSPLAGVVRYFTTYYTLEEGHLIVETGVFNRKRKEIPFRVITTVDLSQNILYQLFNTYKIKIDNASQTNDTINKAEVELALKADEAFMFKQIVTQNTTKEIVFEENANVVKVSPKDFIKLGLLQSKFAYFFIIASTVGPLVAVIVSLVTGSDNIEKLFFSILSKTSLINIIVGTVIFLYLTALGWSIVNSLYTYFNFSISANNDSLKIEYGLFNKKKFTLKKSKINGIILKQNLLMRLFKCYTAEILVIGYGDNSDGEAHEQAIIYPIASMSKIKSIIKELLPEFELEQDTSKPKSKSLKYFFFNFGFVVASMILIGSLFTKNIIPIAIAGVIELFAACSIVLQYFNSGIMSSERNIVISFGGFHKNIAIVKTASVENITASGSILKRKQGFVSIRVGFVAPLRASKITALNRTIDEFEELEAVISR